MITVAGIDPCQNQTDGRLNQNFSYDNFSAPNHQTFDNIKQDITPHRPSPKCPQFNSLPARLSTFHQWPLQRPGPLQLAQAGLLYLGKMDQTVCYYCGGGLSTWEPEDDPESEHEHWYPHCELVKRRKQPDANSCTKSISVSKQERDPEDPMKSFAVECLREFGYTPENIKKAVDRLTIQTVDAKELVEENQPLRDMISGHAQMPNMSRACARLSREKQEQYYRQEKYVYILL